ncbi:MAG: diguanylate cyclase [Candidatus Saccharicenans sp.]|nr:diguanylate cyclase [Candidatus Saccharicenans sp.]
MNKKRRPVASKPSGTTSKQSLGPILVAEDDRVTMNLLERKLSGWGYQVHRAEDGQQAWHFLKRPEIRIALLDWMMPGMEGPELCHKLRQSKKSHYTYLILLTSRDTSFDIIQGLEAGADDYMTKPINLLELRARLQTAHRIINLEDNLIKAKRRLSRLASTDSLTHAWNRRAIFGFLAEELSRFGREGRPFGLLMIDIDHFKEINDRYGHPAGDSVLKQLVTLVRSNLRNYDRVARYGGDELILLLPGSDKKATETIASRLLERVRQHRFKISRRISIQITISVGSTTVTSSHDMADNLVKAADRALYQAKKLGRDRMVMLDAAEKNKK